MKVVKKEVIKNITNKTNLSKDDSARIFEFFLKGIKLNSVSKIVKIGKFGVFSFKDTPERIGRNPKTKENFRIKSFKRLTFKPSIHLKKIIN
tara:strand:- start:579 stop:854 length:276 start_codon:yes stop_codon:yes gene_type:complete